MAKQNINSKKGFTIIEVVLVLAIAGLIFLMVFIALPALQRSQRNTQRRDDYSMLSTAVTNYMSNNGGRLSKLVGTEASKNLEASRWINETGTDPNGNPYHVTAYASFTDMGDNKPSTDETDKGSEVYVVIGSNCNGSDDNGDAMPAADSSSNAFAIYGYMEGGTFYCQASGSIDRETSGE